MFRPPRVILFAYIMNEEYKRAYSYRLHVHVMMSEHMVMIGILR